MQEEQRAPAMSAVDALSSLADFLASDDDETQEKSGHDGVDAFPPRVLVWEEITKQVPKAEWPVMRTVLGESLLEKNESLKAELLSLEGIYNDLSTQRSEHEQGLARARATRHRSRIPGLDFADPPMKEALKRDIQAFISSVWRDPLAVSEPCVVESVLRPQTARERVVLEYATAGAAVSLSPSPHSAGLDGDVSAGTRSARQQSDSRPTSASWAVRAAAKGARPSSAASRSTSSLSDGSSSQHSRSQHSNAAEVVHEVAGFLRVDGFDTVVQQLRKAVSLERDQLLEELDCLRACLDEEMDGALSSGALGRGTAEQKTQKEEEEEEYEEVGGAAAVIPSVAELQTLSSRIKEEWKTSQERAARIDMLQQLPTATNRSVAGPAPLGAPAKSRKRPSSKSRARVSRPAGGTATAAPVAPAAPAPPTMAAVATTPPRTQRTSSALGQALQDANLAPTPPRHPRPSDAAPAGAMDADHMRGHDVSHAARTIRSGAVGVDVHTAVAAAVPPQEQKRTEPHARSSTGARGMGPAFTGSKTAARLRELGLDGGGGCSGRSADYSTGARAKPKPSQREQRPRAPTTRPQRSGSRTSHPAT